MTDLSPAAQAVLHAFWDAPVSPSRNVQIAAALRALADQLAYGHAKSAIIDKDEVLTIAAELEGDNEPTFTPEEIEMIQAPWSYLQSQQEIENE